MGKCQHAIYAPQPGTEQGKCGKTGRLDIDALNYTHTATPAVAESLATFFQFGRIRIGFDRESLEDPQRHQLAGNRGAGGSSDDPRDRLRRVDRHG